MTRLSRTLPLRSAGVVLAVAALAASCASGGSARTGADELYVSPGGAAAGTCTQSTPCSSLDRAYHVARPGQVVVMLGGLYAAQSIRSDPTKESASTNVIFRAASGATPTLANSTFTISGSHVEFHHLSMDETGCVNDRVAPPCPQLLIQAPAHHVVVDDFRASRFFITGAYNVTVKDSDFGPSWDNHGLIHADTAGHRPHDIVLANVAVHDHLNSEACKAQPGCIGAHHQGCGPTINDSYNVVEDRMRFFNCQDLGQLVKPFRFGNENITIQNSWFGANGGFYSLDLTSDAKTPNSGLHILNNTFAKGISASRNVTYRDSDLTGNIIQAMSKLGCSSLLGGGWNVTYNLVGGTSPCGQGGRASTNFRFAPDGLHLERGSPAIDAVRKPPAGSPRTDIDGQRRPRRSAADAGADQREPATLVLGRSVGVAALGMSADAIVAFYGQPASRRARVKAAKDPRLKYASYRVHGGWLTIAFAGGRVVGIATSSPYYTTSTGFGVRSGRAGLQRAKWLACRSVFQQDVNGIHVLYRIVGGRRGKSVGSVAMLQARFRQC
jgi:hypothetical protein